MEQRQKIISRLKKIVNLFLAFAVVLTIIYFPTHFLSQAFKKQEIFPYSKTREWGYKSGEIGFYPECAYVLFGKYLMYCLDSEKRYSIDEVNTIPLDVSIEAPKSFFSELLHIPNTSLEQEVCFSTSNHFANNPESPLTIETKVFLSSKPVTHVNEIEEKNTTILTISDVQCLKAMSGITLIGLGHGVATLFDEPFVEGIRTAGKTDLPLQVGEVAITHSGSHTYINGVEVEVTDVKEVDGQRYFEGRIPLESFGFDIVQELNVYAKLSMEQKFILAIAAYSLWLISIKTLIENTRYFCDKLSLGLGEGLAQVWEFILWLWKWVLLGCKHVRKLFQKAHGAYLNFKKKK